MTITDRPPTRRHADQSDTTRWDRTRDAITFGVNLAKSPSFRGEVHTLAHTLDITLGLPTTHTHGVIAATINGRDLATLDVTDLATEITTQLLGPRPATLDDILDRYATWRPRSIDAGLLATRVTIHDVDLTDDEIRLIEAAQRRTGYDDLLDACADDKVAVATLLDRLARHLDTGDDAA